MSSEPQQTSPGQTSQQRGFLGDLPFRVEVLLEPKGFIRLLEFVLAICMFATTAGYNSMFSFEMTCSSAKAATRSETVGYNFGYPFSFSDKIPTTCFDPVAIEESPSGAAKFFVVVGVFAMLYTIAAVVWYVVLEAKYIQFEIVSLVDFGATVVFTLLFFIASCAWAAGVSTVKFWTTLDNLTTENGILSGCTADNVTCKSEETPGYGGLNISILFGFLNAVVWGGNVWFVWKETPWFRARSEAQTGGDLTNKA
ncbi:putative synaptophysin [Apostichopus japonicus]|uniref:Putative synaptophysin n=1 Tax=Stichopus japonicus TaxID=307972 RepID=A0A2G8K8Q6_STIJA|nr:putative synaptophysin [Apostichopus japonicus]